MTSLNTWNIKFYATVFNGQKLNCFIVLINWFNKLAFVEKFYGQNRYKFFLQFGPDKTDIEFWSQKCDKIIWILNMFVNDSAPLMMICFNKMKKILQDVWHTTVNDCKRFDLVADFIRMDNYDVQCAFFNCIRALSVVNCNSKDECHQVSCGWSF